MKRAAFVSTLAFLFVVAGQAPAHADYPGPLTDFLPTPAPVLALTPASDPQPTVGVTDPVSYGAGCGGWYRQRNYADNWPAPTTWWEARCMLTSPDCWPTCWPESNPDVWTDFFYWNGSEAVFYGSTYEDAFSGSDCLYWWDAAAAHWYQFDHGGCMRADAAPNAWIVGDCPALYCNFDGTQSWATDGIASYMWEFGDGTTGTGATPSHLYPGRGPYQVMLTVTDNGGKVAARSAMVGPLDIPPVASFTYTCDEMAMTCTFNGSASYDPDGTVNFYYWYFGDANNPTAGGSIVQHTYSQAGAYQVGLEVFDDANRYSWAPWQNILITGPHPDIAPTASFTSACAVRRCQFDPSASTDPDGTIARYDWTFVDANNVGFGAISYAPTSMDRTFPHDGTWVVTLTVTDNQGVKGSASQTLTLTDLPPTANFSWSCAALACSFDGNASADPDGTIRSFSWDFGDGASATTAATQHYYANAGSYSVTLSVTDDAGLVGTQSKSVTVVATMPTASFTVTCTAGACTFDGSGSTDVGGTITTYAWTFGDGGAGQGKLVSHLYSSTGTYNATLTVTDSGGVTTSTSKTASSIKLTATVAKVTNLRQVSLRWAGSNATSFEVYRNGAWIVTVVGTSYTEAFSKPGTYTYKVCEANKSICSNSVTVSV